MSDERDKMFKDALAAGYRILAHGKLDPYTIERCAKVAACDCCDVCGESPGYPKCANVIADEIRALGKGEG